MGTREVVLGRVLGCNQRRIRDVVTVHWKFGHKMHRSQLDGDGYHAGGVNNVNRRQRVFVHHSLDHLLHPCAAYNEQLFFTLCLAQGVQHSKRNIVVLGLGNFVLSKPFLFWCLSGEVKCIH
jgi:hypothetical protein